MANEHNSKSQRPSRGHHFVSCCYLKNFTEGGTETSNFRVVDLIEGKTYPNIPRRVAIENGFDRIEVEGHAPDALDKAYGEFEAEVDQMLGRVATSSIMAAGEDRNILVNFLTFLAVRNPRLRGLRANFDDRLFRTILDVATSSPEIWASQIAGMKRAGMHLPADTSYETARAFVEKGDYTIDRGTNVNALVELDIYDKVLPTMGERGWLHLNAAPDAGHFITSDHPVVLVGTTNRKGPRRIGYGIPDTQVIFPLSSTACLVGEFGRPDHSAIADRRAVAHLNYVIAKRSQRRVFARDDRFWYGLRDEEICEGARMHEDERFRSR